MSATIPPADFVRALRDHDVDLFAGVPDSLLTDLVAGIEASAPAGTHIITANEGNAVALAAGYHIATGKHAAVYLQNSGLGNTVNPLLSLADPAVYGIPLLMIIGWRGEPGVADEPQHVTQGRLTIPLLATLEIEHVVLDAEGWEHQVEWATETLRTENRPIALVVRKGLFGTFPAPPHPSALTLSREAALEVILDEIDPADFVVATTGKTSREVFEIRERRGQGHAHDLLTVGGMGHVSSLAMGMAFGTERRVYTIDGDGAFLMHLGAIATTAQKAPQNFRYLLINNGAHESVGGQPTVAFDIDVSGILIAAGFGSVETVREPEDLAAAVRRLAQTPRHALVVDVAQGSRPELGRPTVSPQQNKLDMMREFHPGGGR